MVNEPLDGGIVPIFSPGSIQVLPSNTKQLRVTADGRHSFLTMFTGEIIVHHHLAAIDAGRAVGQHDRRDIHIRHRVAVAGGVGGDQVRLFLEGQVL